MGSATDRSHMKGAPLNNPDPLEIQGQIDAMRIVLGALIANLPVDARRRCAEIAKADGEEFQAGRVPQMAHPTYQAAFDALIRELA